MSARCPNTCEEKGKEAQKGVLAEIKMIEEGVAIKDEYTQQGKSIKNEKQSEVEELRKQMEDIKAKFDEAKSMAVLQCFGCVVCAESWFVNEQRRKRRKRRKSA